MNRRDWSDIWRRARNNMPKRKPQHMGSSTVLRLLLNYKIYKDNGDKLSCNEHVFTAIQRGSPPRDPKRKALLKALAGPHGPTIAKAIAARRGLNLSAYTIWP